MLILSLLFSTPFGLIFLGTKDLSYTYVIGHIVINCLWIQKWGRKNKLERSHVTWHMILEIIL